AAGAPVRSFYVPGRIEVLGKHTDYGGGSSLVTAVEHGFCLAAVPRADAVVRVWACDLDGRAEFRLDPELEVPHGHWSNYPMTAARRLARNFPEARRGLDLAFASDLPPASGMSSSSALIVASFLVIAAVNELRTTARYRRSIADELELAAYLGCVENGQSFGELTGDRGVGTFGGSEDHTAILCSQPRCLGQFAYCPARFQRRIPVPAGTALAVGVSGAVAEKTGAAQELYNRASRRLSALVELWRAHTGGGEQHIAPILERGPDAEARLRRLIATGEQGEFTAAELEQRLDHFVGEMGVIGPAGDALAAGDLAGFGALVDRSQRLSEELLGNQIPETAGLARLARAAGAHAASAFGAGFGGSVWALVDEARADVFLKAWGAAYGQAFPERAARADFFLTQAGPAAFVLQR
ncbi:MAG: galactokinase family protein, partial [Gemmatimonadota bacterium]